jgi:hypothetical protein
VVPGSGTLVPRTTELVPGKWLHSGNVHHVYRNGVMVPGSVATIPRMQTFPQNQPDIPDNCGTYRLMAATPLRTSKFLPPGSCPRAGDVATKGRRLCEPQAKRFIIKGHRSLPNSHSTSRLQPLFETPNKSNRPRDRNALIFFFYFAA